MSKRGIFFGCIKDGKIILDNREIFKLFLKTLEGKRIELSLEKEGDDYTLAQMRYLYAAVYTPLANELGYSVEEIDGVLKKKLLTRNKGTKREFVKDKHTLNRKDLSEYIDHCIQIAAEVGIVCLPANKYGLDKLKG